MFSVFLACSLCVVWEENNYELFRHFKNNLFFNVTPYHNIQVKSFFSYLPTIFFIDALFATPLKFYQYTECLQFISQFRRQIFQ